MTHPSPLRAHRGRPVLVRLLLLIGLLGVAAPERARADGFPTYGGFHSVLAFGEGESTSAADLAGFEANGSVPADDVSEVKPYEGLEQAWPGIGAADLDTYFRDSSFTPEPASAMSASGLGPLTSTGAPPAVESPEAGVTVVRTPPLDVPRIYGSNRGAAMYAAGYVTAEDRLFLMDVLRHTAEGTTAELLGASAVPADSRQLGLQDATPAQLTAEVRALPSIAGAPGAQALSDIEQYVAGINAFISLTRSDPLRLPAEYPALGITPQPWTLADSAAVGLYLIGQFTVFGGDQGQQAEALGMFERRLGVRAGVRAFTDFRLGADPAAQVTLARRFDSDRLGRVRAASEALIDPGSLHLRDAVTGGSVASPARVAARSRRVAGGSLPAWARNLAVNGLHLPHLESNAVLVDGARSGTGQALAAMGPQVGYYTPEVFLEYEMHAPGIDVSGVSFPGASPYPLIGHGADFAWTGTSAFSANEDVFAEQLCNPNGDRTVSFAATGYRWHGVCRPFRTGTVTEQTPVAPTSPSAPTTVVLHTLNSVHGPITSYGTVHGVPVALATAPATAGNEIGSYVAFMDLAENVPTSPQSFVSVMHQYTGSENWFYVDQHHIGVLESGWFPRHAPGTDPDLPIWGTGQWDWRGFHPYPGGYGAGFTRLPDSANPTVIDPPSGYLVNWNNAIAHGWRVAAGDWENGQATRADILQTLLEHTLDTVHPLTLAGLVNGVTAPSLTADVRGIAVWPLLRRVLGRGGPAGVRSLVRLLDGWARGGSQRRSLTYGGDVADGPAVQLMDTWWPRLVRAEFLRGLGRPLVDFIDREFNTVQPDGIRDGTGNGFFAGWYQYVIPDLEAVLGGPHAHIPGRFGRTYCGGGTLRGCRALLRSTLLAAAAQLEARLGPAQSDWKLATVCPVTPPPLACDEIVPTSAGAISIPPQPYDNRGTFYQADAITGHRP